MIVSPCIKLWCPKCWNQLRCLSACKKSTSSLTSCLRYCKDIANLLFWELWECLTISIKTIVLICRKFSCSSACEKSTSSFTSFVRYCKEIANLIFWVIGVCLATHTSKMILSIWRNLSIWISIWDIGKILQKCYLGILGMPGFAHPKWYYQLVENFCVDLQAKKKLHCTFFALHCP